MSYSYTHQGSVTHAKHRFGYYGAIVVVIVVGVSTFTYAESEMSMLQLSVTVTVSDPAVSPAVYKPLLSIVLPMLLKTSQLLHGVLHSPFRVVLNCMLSQVYTVALVGLMANSHARGFVVVVVVIGEEVVVVAGTVEVVVMGIVVVVEGGSE